MNASTSPAKTQQEMAVMERGSILMPAEDAGLVLSMALELFIPPYIHNPRHCLHPPPPTGPLGIQIHQKLVPKTSWNNIVRFLQPGGLELASLTHRTLYGEE